MSDNSINAGYEKLLAAIFGEDPDPEERSPEQMTPSKENPVLPLGNPEGARLRRSDPYKELAERISSPRRG